MFTHLKIDLQNLLDDGISREDAIVLVITSVEKEKLKRKQTIKEAVEIAAGHTVSKAFSAHRATICKRAEKITRARKQNTETMRNKVAGLMKFRLPSGVAFEHATGSDCAEAAVFYMTNATVHYHRAMFLRKVADLAGKKRVSEVLQEADLQQAYESAERLS